MFSENVNDRNDQKEDDLDDVIKMSELSNFTQVLIQGRAFIATLNAWHMKEPELKEDIDAGIEIAHEVAKKFHEFKALALKVESQKRKKKENESQVDSVSSTSTSGSS